MGVRRAVESAMGLAQSGKTPLFTLGPLIHNPQVLELLERQGVRMLDPEEGRERAHGTVVIRAHGVPPRVKEQLAESGAEVVDATCPRVLKVQAIIEKYRRQDHATIIVGDRDHAEVVGLLGYAGDKGTVVSNIEEVDDLALTPPYIVVSQTTQDEEEFFRIRDAILERFPGGKVFNTICDSTHKRQEEVRRLCADVDALVVVGGRNSANTRRLAEIASQLGREVHLVETAADLDLEALSGHETVGVTAGASTPTWIIEDVVQALEGLGRSHPGAR